MQLYEFEFGVGETARTRAGPGAGFALGRPGSVHSRSTPVGIQSGGGRGPWGSPNPGGLWALPVSQNEISEIPQRTNDNEGARDRLARPLSLPRRPSHPPNPKPLARSPAGLRRAPRSPGAPGTSPAGPRLTAAARRLRALSEDPLGPAPGRTRMRTPVPARRAGGNDGAGALPDGRARSSPGPLGTRSALG